MCMYLSIVWRPAAAVQPSEVQSCMYPRRNLAVQAPQPVAIAQATD